MSKLLNNYITASNAYPERLNSKELTPILIDNANRFIAIIQEFFEELGLNLENYQISSGFRPSYVNATIGNAAKKSLHQQCLAIDIVDDQHQSLAKLMQQKASLRKLKCIWLESPMSTQGKVTNWVHLDISLTRPKRDSMEFVP